MSKYGRVQLELAEALSWAREQGWHRGGILKWTARYFYQISFSTHSSFGLVNQDFKQLSCLKGFSIIFDSLQNGLQIRVHIVWLRPLIIQLEADAPLDLLSAMSKDICY